MTPTDRLTAAWLAWQRELRGFLRRRMPASEVDDVAQDTWLRLHERSDPRHWRDPRAVVFTTARNLAVDAARQADVRGRARAVLAVSAESAPVIADPATEIDHAHQLERLARALDELPWHCREALLLCRIDGLSHVAIARRLGVSTKSVQRYLERALRHCVEAASE